MTQIRKEEDGGGKLRVLDLFSGIGGLALGLERTGGFVPAAFCEIEPYCRQVLARHWPEVPQYDDVRTLTADRLRADGVTVDAICGGFPCQDISWAGFGGGLSGSRSGLWFEYARLVGELRPDLVIVENVAALLARGIDVVCGTLAAFGYDAEWSPVSGCSVGLPHPRQRMFLVAYPNGVDGRQRVRYPTPRPDWALQEVDRFTRTRARSRARLANPSSLYRGADGVPFGMERNRAIGNAVSPDVGEFVGHKSLAILAAHASARTFPLAAE
ncbi:DNA cytosine methyltransferase [Methylobacterium gnaphalii]|uniref:Cytosine-specific methyltransferase n=1 Tax=Methylobacterium gnaphalii TaxID=1010610 RepID=A0A512JP14_9HYPH|nr:DNA (cytosine-5-)-methyltransferase [Methylobacterium gnaphalii]GEP11697.1 hypothetical protein MGN01_35420 [Methylobacterium gnaphalii]GJD68788.1 hypothetical protein MMMDOFMJ_1712 [Methylobacterium gnaphalii]GLS50194.1 hypothetical protein GCM10007885_30460 [Methylobacterium gnaphalii]